MTETVLRVQEEIVNGLQVGLLFRFQEEIVAWKGWNGLVVAPMDGCRRELTQTADQSVHGALLPDLPAVGGDAEDQRFDDQEQRHPLVVLLVVPLLFGHVQRGHSVVDQVAADGACVG